MKRKLSYTLFILAFFSLPFSVSGQYRSPNGDQSRGRGQSSGQVIGKVVESSSNKGIGYATVGVLSAKDSSVVSGVLSKENGDFAVEALGPGNYILRINFIGYTTVYRNFELTAQSMSKDLGNFKLSSSAATLKTVDVTAEKPAYSMTLDKKVFDVSKSLTTIGGDATDVLKQVPSVNVDIDGNVTLRNGSPTIFVDGKRTTLTLDEIPAESIDRIEVITNPSAKYDAEGMSGILNIILKKNRKPGVNGSLRAGADTRGGYNAGGNLNIYQNPFNVSLSYFAHDRRGPYSSTTDRHNIFNDSWLNQKTEGKRGGMFQMGRLGVDYFLDNRNTLSLEAGMGGGSFTSTEELSSDFLNSGKTLDSSSIRNTKGVRGFRFYSGDLGYKHNFQKEGHTLTADLNLRKSVTPPKAGYYETRFFDSEGNPMDEYQKQTNYTDGNSTFFTGQIDYVNPLSEISKLEAGLKTSVRNMSSIYNVFDVESGHDILNALLSSDYTFDEDIYAGYIQFSSQFSRFGYQAGLRAEQYMYDGAIPSQNLTFKPESDKLGLYPSLYLTYKISQEDQLQLNYSRRVDRPNFWQRIPYIDYSDPLNLRTGNADLKPEYTNSFEFSYNKFFGQSNFMATLYYHNTNNSITRYTEPFNDSKDTLISYSINAQTANDYGAEFTVQTQITNWWNVTGNVNLFQTDLTANVKSQTLANSKFSWFGKVNSNMKLPASFSLQLSGRYNAPIATPQGTMKRFGSVDIGIKKDFFEKKNASVTLSLSDIFNTERQESYSMIPEVYTQNSMRKRASRYLGINFTYNFGKQDFQLFKRKANKSQQSDQQSGQDMPPDQQF